jgi:hypothetical protein
VFLRASPYLCVNFWRILNFILVLELLNLHHRTFFEAKPFADETQHPNPSDTRGWSQILVSLLYQKKGLARQKGADIEDGSDVKAASTWDAIDMPRFNGVIKAGTKSELSGNMASLDIMPKLFFVLWDNEPENKRERCRVWVVRPQHDTVFREICEKWYKQRDEGLIKSDNFQLHPPRNLNHDVFRNTCGNLNYPLFFSAEWVENQYTVTFFDENILENGFCSYAD